MRTIEITTNDEGAKAPIRFLRDENPFESLESYVENELIPFCVANCDDMFAIRCSISGWLIGSHDEEEIKVAIRQAAATTRIAALSNPFKTFTVKSLKEDIEEVIQVVLTRTLLLSRPSIIFNGSIGRPAIESVPRNRQLITLLNILVYDNGQIRARHNDSFDTMFRMKRAAHLADQIAAEWDGEIPEEGEDENQFFNLYTALVELNAKWQLAKLRFTNKEAEKLKAIRDSKEFDIKRLTTFVWGLITHRDKHEELNPADDWTRKAYREIATAGYASANNRQDQSNVLNPIKPSEVSAARGEKPRTAKGKVSKSKDSKVSMFSDIFKGIF